MLFQYNSPQFALSIPTLRIHRGEAVSIIGRSGVGKTTLLSLILGLVKPDHGKIAIEGDAPLAARRGGAFGVAFQNPVLLPWLNIFQNVTLPWRLRGVPADLERAEALLAGVGLWKYRHAYPGDLSGGMRSRVSLARALACAPPIFVLDEPFSSLDEFTRTQMAILVSSLQAASKSTMIFVTHNMTEALLISDRIVLLGRPRDSTKPVCIINEFSAAFRNQTSSITSSEAFRRMLAELAACFSDEEGI
ncbi:hypothetical protein TSA1_19855 [Bradyrhizobium nitroreducens]|uniref:ABC transporter domain-containing protein n=1 Tax=Bradyrhizobium nitroreducens TaxID=709803 RepID=A0A2M6UNU1_9BRAD|nr:hypothetical protein TSA1_19855 [Bradyrhizobium nitroreducens]